MTTLKNNYYLLLSQSFKISRNNKLFFGVLRSISTNFEMAGVRKQRYIKEDEISKIMNEENNSEISADE